MIWENSYHTDFLCQSIQEKLLPVADSLHIDEQGTQVYAGIYLLLLQLFYYFRKFHKMRCLDENSILLF